MILLHVTVVALYGLTAYALWPAAAGHGTPSRTTERFPPGVVAWLVTSSVTRSTHDAAKVSDRLDRVFQHVNAQDS